MSSSGGKCWAILICLCLLALLGLAGGHELRTLQEFEATKPLTTTEVAHD